MTFILGLVIGATLPLLIGGFAWLATHQVEDVVTIPDDWDE